MKELGGYFELEVRPGAGFHKNALALNSARNCLKYILKAQRPAKVYLPAYCCNSLLEPLVTEEINYSFYHLDDQFEIEGEPELQVDERLLYINYYSFKSNYIYKLYRKYGQQLIVDNSQAFFEPPLPGVDTFYSPRKFFGVADGGYLYTDKKLKESQVMINQDVSSQRFAHLVGRIEKNASSYYAAYRSSEENLGNQPIKYMSELTERLLGAIDYCSVSLKRQRNFWALHSMLKHGSWYDINDMYNTVPMTYIFFTDDNKLREFLLEEKILVPCYWPGIEQRLSGLEKKFIENILPLPIDQRVSLPDLSRISRLMMNGKSADSLLS